MYIYIYFINYYIKYLVFEERCLKLDRDSKKVVIVYDIYNVYITYS
jgi:hypothetical protein